MHYFFFFFAIFLFIPCRSTTDIKAQMCTVSTERPRAPTCACPTEACGEGGGLPGNRDAQHGAGDAGHRAQVRQERRGGGSLPPPSPSPPWLTLTQGGDPADGEDALLLPGGTRTQPPALLGGRWGRIQPPPPTPGPMRVPFPEGEVAPPPAPGSARSREPAARLGRCKEECRLGHFARHAPSPTKGLDTLTHTHTLTLTSGGSPSIVPFHPGQHLQVGSGALLLPHRSKARLCPRGLQEGGGPQVSIS